MARQIASGARVIYVDHDPVSAQLHVRSQPEIQRFFDGFELLEPGVVWMTEWRPDPGVPPTGQPRSLRAGVGRKP